jgi:AraC-like DNA-binding protein
VNATVASQIKVWRPTAQLEIERHDHVVIERPSELLLELEWTVLFAGRAELWYRGEWIRSDAVNAPVFFVQNSGEVALRRSIARSALTLWTLKVQPLAWTAAGCSTHPFFPSTTINSSAVNARLVAHTKEVILAFEQSASSLERHSLLNTLLTETERWCSQLPRRPLGRAREHRAVRIVQAFLEANCAEDVTLKQLSQLVQLNHDYLLEVFKRHVGISPHVYQTYLRLSKAKRLLAQNEPIAQVAVAVGLVDQSHLNRLFKRYVHVTPKQFQRWTIA